MAAIQDLVITFCPKMRCVSQKKLSINLDACIINHLNTKELVKTDFQRFTGKGHFARANIKQIKVYETNK